MHRLLAAMMLAAVAGCAALESGAPKPVQYVCDNDRRFSVAYHPGGESATLELDRMQFALRREPSASGAKYGCDVLTLWTKGPEAMIDMQGSKAYSNCRTVNP
ncbi:MAG TPA: MliC family protein [Burkholderiales bacterium]|nr:MliC family protein [Burkholderiales bacterium]